MKTLDKVNDLLDVVARLSKLIQEENALISKGTHEPKLEQIIQNKKTLTAIYENQIQNFDENNLLKNTDSSSAQRLKETMNTFQQLVEENAFRLSARIEATKRVFQVIQTAVQDHGGETKTYGNSGCLKDSARQAYTPALSVGVNDEC